MKYNEKNFFHVEDFMISEYKPNRSFYARFNPKNIKKKIIKEQKIQNNLNDLSHVKTNFHFFIDRHGSWGTWNNVAYACCASKSDGGYFILANGNPLGSFDKYLYLDSVKERDDAGDTYKEISLNELKDRMEPEAFLKMCNFLKIRLEKLMISPELKEELIGFLKRERAFNEDSAIFINEDKVDYYFQLSSEGLVKEFEGKYYFI